MALTLKLTATSSVPIEVEGVSPDTIGDRSLSEIEKMEVFLGNRKLPLAELFHIQGDPSDGQMIWEGDMSGVHWIGAKMVSGTIQVRGRAGRHVGSEMSGGAIHVEEDAGDWVGGEMHGGLIHVRGRAGHLVGAAYRGSRQGMTGGTILIGGDVGNEFGHSMRRGLLAVGGNAGDLGGFNMIAGTLLVFGDGGIRHGAGMRRGTIGLLGPSRPQLLPTFRRACRGRPVVFSVIFRRLRDLQFAVPEMLMTAEFDLYHGDMVAGGRGEVFLRAADT